MRMLAFITMMVVTVQAGSAGRFLNGQFPPYPACSASDNAVCSPANTVKVVDAVIAKLDGAADPKTVLAEINDPASALANTADGVGFDAIVIDKSNNCVASVAYGCNHTNPKKFSDIEKAQVPAVHQDNLIKNIRDAAADDGWLSFVWDDETPTDAKQSSPKAHIGYFKQTNNAQEKYIVGVHYADQKYPESPYCTSGKNDGCSVINCRSLVGEATSKMMMASDQTVLNEVFRSISKESDFKVMRPDGSFTGFYVFVYKFDLTDNQEDTKGINIAHGANANFVGKNLTEILAYVGNKLVDGEQLHQKFYTAAANGGGWVDYDWANAVGSPPTPKIAFISGVKKFGVKYYLGVGFNDIRNDDSQGAHCSQCSSGTSAPCAIRNTFNLMSQTQAQFLKEASSELELWDTVSISSSFKIAGGFYVFAYDFNSTCVLHGANIKNVGRTLPGIIKGAKLPVDGEQLHKDFKNAAMSGGGWVRYTWQNKGETSSYIKVAYLIKVSKFGREYYAGVGYTEKPFVPTDKISAHYSSAGVVNNLLSVVGLTQAKINNAWTQDDLQTSLAAITNDSAYTFSDNGFSPSLGTFKVNDGTYVQVIDEHKKIRADGGNPDNVGKTLDEATIANKIDSYSGSQFFDKIMTSANDGAGGAWFKFKYKTTDKLTALDKVAYATKAHYSPPHSSTSGSEYIKETFYIVSQHFTRPQPAVCGSCPEHSHCMPPAEGETIGFCACDPQYKAEFTAAESAAADTCEDGFSKTFQRDYTMVCALDTSATAIKYNHLSSSLKSAAAAVVILVYITILGLAVWVSTRRNHVIVKAAQPTFLYMILFGCLLSTSSIWPLAMDDNGVAPVVSDTGVLSWPEMDAACQTVPWLYCFGFALSFSSLFAKTRRVTKIFVNKKMARVKVTLKETLMWVTIVVAFEFVILCIWQATSPLKWQRTITKVDGDGNEVESYGMCSSDDTMPFVMVLFVFQLLFLIYGCVIAYKSRKVNTQFAESSWIFLCMVNNVQSLLVGVPILYMVYEQPNVFFIMKFFIIVVTDVGILALIFGPKVYRQMTKGNQISSITAGTAATAATSDGVVRVSGADEA